MGFYKKLAAADQLLRILAYFFVDTVVYPADYLNVVVWLIFARKSHR